VDNTATAIGTAPDGSTVEGEATATVTLPQNPVISILKAGVFNDEDGDGYADVGETPVTQSDINAGQVDNTATAIGTAPDGSTVEGEATATVTLSSSW